MTKRFQAQVADQIRMVKARAKAVVQGAAQQVIMDAQRPSKKGGKMRVDTGFLRNSFSVSFDGLPSGPIRGERGAVYEFEGEAMADVIAQIANMEPGDKIFGGWTANYARIRESRDGFLRLSVQRWQEIVDRQAALARARIRVS